MPRAKKQNKKVVVSFCTTAEVLEGIDALKPTISEMQGRELSRSEVIELGLLLLFKSFMSHAKEYEANTEKEENKVN